jgi:hypothetical protein
LEHNDGITVLRRIWTENKIPEEWYKGIIILTCKRQTGNNLGNYKRTHAALADFQNIQQNTRN